MSNAQMYSRARERFLEGRIFVDDSEDEWSNTRACLVSRRHAGPGSGCSPECLAVVYSLNRVPQLANNVSVRLNESGPIDGAANAAVYGRYMGKGSPLERMYTQDDDCIVDAGRLLQFKPMPGRIVCNMPAIFRPHYQDGIALVGFGALFFWADIDRAFNEYLEVYRADELFFRECDRIATGLNDLELVDVPYINLPGAEAPGRMWKEPRHHGDLAEIRRRIYRIRESRKR